MIPEDRARGIVGAALAACGGAEAEALLAAEDSALTRFAESQIHQNVAQRDVVLAVRARVGKRLGEAETRDLSPAGVARAAVAAVALAKAAPEEGDPLPFLGAERHEAVDGFDPAATLEAFDPARKARAVCAAIERARSADLTAAGSYEHSAGLVALGNTAGLSAIHRASSCRFVMTATGKTSTGWAEASGRGPSQVDPEAVARRAVEKAILGRDPAPLPEGAYTVILEPPAVASLLGFLAWGFDRLAVEEGRSFLSGGRHRRIGGASTTLRADFSHPLHRGRPFDGEGLPRRRLVLIEKGEVRDLFTDRRTALRLGGEPTGHSPGGRNAWGAAPEHLVLDAGTASLGDLIHTTERGFLLTRTWYENFVDPMECAITGMTRDGLLLVEKGRIAGGVRNFRFNESVIAALGRAEPSSALSLHEGIACPALRVEAFHFTKATEF